MFEETDLVLTLSQLPETFLTNPSKLRIYLCKIPTVITETFEFLMNSGAYQNNVSHCHQILGHKNSLQILYHHTDCTWHSCRNQLPRINLNMDSLLMSQV